MHGDGVKRSSKVPIFGVSTEKLLTRLWMFLFLFGFVLFIFADLFRDPISKELYFYIKTIAFLAIGGGIFFAIVWDKVTLKEDRTKAREYRRRKGLRIKDRPIEQIRRKLGKFQYNGKESFFGVPTNKLLAELVAFFFISGVCAWTIVEIFGAS